MIYWKTDAKMMSLLTFSLLLINYCSVIGHRRCQNVVRTSVTHLLNGLCATVLFLPHFGTTCDLSLNRYMATWSLIVNNYRTTWLPCALWSVINLRSQVEIDWNSIHIQHCSRCGRRDWCPLRQPDFPKSTAQGILSRWSPIRISTPSKRA